MKYLKFFSLNQVQSKVSKELKSIFNSSNGWLTSKDFSEMLRNERHRSDRTGLPISYILIDLTRFSNREIKISNSDYHSFIENLMLLIANNTRKYDVKCKVEPFKIGVLLIDTSFEGAKAFIEKISERLIDDLQSRNQSDFIRFIQSITISSYPINQVHGVDKIEGIPIILKDLQFQNKRQDRNVNSNQRLMLKENSKIHINWNINISSDGTIALTTPIFEDIVIYQNHTVYRFCKRIVDIIGSLLAITLFAPLMLIIAVLIKASSKGPVIFKQKRVGHLGKPFTFLKFRTMVNRCDERIHQAYVSNLIEGKNDTTNLGSEDRPLYKLENDPRVTKFGYYLRKTSLDELPQFFNVLIGDMSLVGPRPPIPYEVVTYKSWHMRRVLEAKPGITGLWQVNGRSKTTFDEMVRLDLQYANNQSVLLDIKILLKTFGAVFNAKGAL